MFSSTSSFSVGSWTRSYRYSAIRTCITKPTHLFIGSMHTDLLQFEDFAILCLQLFFGAVVSLFASLLSKSLVELGLSFFELFLHLLKLLVEVLDHSQASAGFLGQSI